MLGPNTVLPYHLLWVSTQSYYTTLPSHLFPGVLWCPFLVVTPVPPWTVSVMHMPLALGGTWYGLLLGLSCNENVPSKHTIPLKTSPNVLWNFCVMTLLSPLSASVFADEVINGFVWFILAILTIGILFDYSHFVSVCTALCNCVHFLSSVCFAAHYLHLYWVNV